eukprot:5203829-Pyramimonas_sp.AAC.1
MRQSARDGPGWHQDGPREPVATSKVNPAYTMLSNMAPTMRSKGSDAAPMRRRMDASAPQGRTRDAKPLSSAHKRPTGVAISPFRSQRPSEASRRLPNNPRNTETKANESPESPEGAE